MLSMAYIVNLRASLPNTKAELFTITTQDRAEGNLGYLLRLTKSAHKENHNLSSVNNSVNIISTEG